MQWLKSEGIELVNLGGYGTNVLSPPWRNGSGLTWQNYGADVALQRLEANLPEAPGPHSARHARPRAEACVRRHRDRSRAGRWRENDSARRAVVIADGGFQANLDMLRKSGISPAPEKLLARNGGTAIGDGLRMAQALGAQRRAAA